MGVFLALQDDDRGPIRVGCPVYGDLRSWLGSLSAPVHPGDPKRRGPPPYRSSHQREQVLAAVKVDMTEQAVKLAEEIVLAVKSAFAEAVTRIYFYLIFIVAAAVAITFFIPELPLRRSNTTTGPEA